MKTTLGWCLASVLFVSALAPSAPARADAAADVRDLLAGRLPVRHALLGWTAAGGAIFRTLVCAEGGTTSCTAAVVVVAPDGDVTTTTLLEVNELYCAEGEPCEALAPAVAKEFVAKERAVLSALPALVPGRAGDTAAVGPVAGAPTELVLRTRDGGERFDTPGVRTELALVGAKGAAVRLETLSEWNARMEGMEIQGVYPSPDGTRLVVVSALGAGEMCWGPFWDLSFATVEIAPAAAKLGGVIAAKRASAD
jgi:hypothetical protein